MPESLHTAAEIAACLGKSPQAVRKQLGDTPATGLRIVNGLEASAWALAVLPPALRDGLAAESRRRGYRDAAAMLAAPPKIWEPAIPLKDVCAKDIEYARCLQLALKRSLFGLNDLSVSRVEMESQRVQDYRRAFGHAITERRWRDVFKRTIDRDAGAENWERLEIYLPDKVTSAAQPKPQDADARAREEFENVWLTIMGCDWEAAEKKAANEELVWKSVFETFAIQPSKALKRRLLDFVWQSASLGKSKEALRVAFHRKHIAWQAGAEILDGRSRKKGTSTADPIPAKDVAKIVDCINGQWGGRARQGLSELARMGDASGLSAGTLDILEKDPENKRLLNVITPLKVLTKPFYGSRKEMGEATPKMRRTVENLLPMDVVTYDDFTLCVVFKVPDGLGWYDLVQGQCLLGADVCCLKILEFLLTPSPQYDGHRIATLHNKTLFKWGIPRIIEVENGIWKKSHLVKRTAPPPNWNNALAFPEVKSGWEKLGVKFNHCRSSWAKKAELVGGLLQNRMFGLRGYSGRDQRYDMPEETRRRKRAFDAKEPGSERYFMDFEEWFGVLSGIMDDYNNTPQHGETLQGLSPNQKFEQLFPHGQISKPDARCWHLFAHYTRDLKVGVDGITFRHGKQEYFYRNERTGQDREKIVRIWFNPETPEFLGVTDTHGRHPYMVARGNKVDYMAAKNCPVLKSEAKAIAEHSAYAKTLYGTVKGTFAPTFRPNLVDPRTQATAEAFTKQRNELATAKRAESTIMSSSLRMARELGVPIELVDGSAEMHETLLQQRDARREHLKAKEGK